jgi:hypothetical protein
VESFIYGGCHRWKADIKAKTLNLPASHAALDQRIIEPQNQSKSQDKQHEPTRPSRLA